MEYFSTNFKNELGYFLARPPHHQQAMRDACSVKQIHQTLVSYSKLAPPLHEIAAMHRDIFDDADRRLVTGESFLHHPHDDPRRWPHLEKSGLVWASAKSPKKDRPLYQIKLAQEDDKQISLSELVIISSCRQRKTPRRKKPSFSDTFAAGPPVNGNKGFPSGWTTRISRWTTATEQPKINVGPQRAQTRQKEKLTWGTTGGNSFGGLPRKDVRLGDKNGRKPRSGYHFPQITDKPPTSPEAAPLGVVGVLNQLSIMRELELAKAELISMKIQMESVTTTLQTSTQQTELLISLVHSISHSLDTSESILLSAIKDPPAEPLVPREKAYPVFTGPIRQKNAAKAIQNGLRRILLKRRQVALPKTIILEAVQKAISFEQAATTRRNLQAKIYRAKIFRPCCRTIAACVIQQRF